MKTHEFEGIDWYWVSRKFPDGVRAKDAFDRLNAEGARQEGKLDIGVYRHGPMDEDQVYVTAVSHRRNGVAVASNLLDGEDVEQDDEVLKLLIMRRIKILGDLYELGADAGSYRVPHAGPVVITPEGEVIDL